MIALLPFLATSLLSALPCLSPRQAVPLPAEPAREAFDAHWYDGRAEVAGYRWRGSRYGEERTGEAVAIFVTESVGAKEHVKVDRPTEYRGEVWTTLKLNLIRDFQTGVYDYNTMTSVWSHVDDLRLVKVSFSSAEWCGHVFETLDVQKGCLRLDVDSYFQGESQEQELPTKPGGLVGDHLWVWLRGLRGHVLAPGASRQVPFLTSAFERRLRHTQAAWSELTVTRAATQEEFECPAGKLAAIVYDLRATDGHSGKAWIEPEYPHRLLGWEWRNGTELLDSGALTGSQRMKYWELQKSEHEKLRAELGLRVDD